MEAAQGALARYCLAAHPPDVLITVPKDARQTLDFHMTAELITLGRDLARQELDQAQLEYVRPCGDPRREGERLPDPLGRSW